MKAVISGHSRKPARECTFYFGCTVGEYFTGENMVQYIYARNVAELKRCRRVRGRKKERVNRGRVVLGMSERSWLVGLQQSRWGHRDRTEVLTLCQHLLQIKVEQIVGMTPGFLGGRPERGIDTGTIRG